jgi:predicted RND superfamily exporter protein/signal transduction histidine kinase
MSRLTALALDRPGTTIAVVLVLSGFFAAQALRVTAETGYRAYIGADHPTVIALDHFIDGFGGGLPMAAVWSCAETSACEHVFDARAVEMASTVVRSLRDRPGVRAVRSPATTTLLVGREDVLESKTALDPADRATMLAEAPENGLWVGRLISPDAQTGAIAIELASSDSDVTRSVLTRLEAALAPFESDGFTFHIVGQTAQFALTDESLAQDSQRLLPVTMGLVALTIALLFRSWQAVLAALAAVGLASLWTTGFMGLMGWPKNAISETIPPLVLVIALSDAIHLLARYSQARAATGARTGSDRAATMLRAAREIARPCFVTSATTAIGLLSFTTSGLDSFVRFGLISGFGVAAALVLAFTVLPILMMWFPGDAIRDVSVTDQWAAALRAMTRQTRRNARGITVVALLVGIVCSVGTARLAVDVDEYKLYGEGSSVVKAFRFIERNLRLPDSLELEVMLPPDQDLRQPETLRQLERFSKELLGIEGLARNQSVLDVIRWSNRLLREGDATHARLPEEAGDATAILSLINLTDPAELEPWVGPDFRRLRFSVEAEKMPQSQRAAVIAEVDGAIDRHLGPGWQATSTGSFVVYHDLVEEIQRTQLRSFGVAAVLILALLAIFLRSLGGTLPEAIKWALIGMFPTVLPVAMTLGVMGYAGIALDMGTAMVAAIIIGIAVDDTVHLLGEFYRRKSEGSSSGLAIDGSVLHIGQAVVTTSVALSAGFFVLLLSSWQSISSFGFLSGVAILGALLADLVVLPALIHLASGEGAEEDEEDWARERKPERKTRALVSFVALTPVLAVSVFSIDGALSPDTRGVIECRTVPNGVVPLIAGSSEKCPLRPLDRIVSIEGGGNHAPGADRDAFAQVVGSATGSVVAEIERSGETVRAVVPVAQQSREDRVHHLMWALAIVGLVIFFALRIYWQSQAGAATALLVLASAVSAEIISVLCASYADSIYWASVPAGPLIGASLAHLALTFPRESQAIRRAPGVLFAPYAFAALLTAAELRALGLAPTLWLLSQRFVLVLAGAASLALLWRSGAALRRERTPLERVRSRALLVGCIGVLVAAVGTIAGFGEGMPTGHLLPLIGGVIAFVVPLGLAIHRYDLFDFSSRALVSLERGAQVALLGLSGAGTIWVLQRHLGLTGPLAWAIGAVVASLSVSVGRRYLVPWIDGTFQPLAAARKRFLETQHETALSASTEDMSARLAGQAIETGLDAAGVALFLRDVEGGWRPAYAGQSTTAFRVVFARAAEEALEGRESLHLVRGDTAQTPNVQTLLEAGVELVVPLKTHAQSLGLLLIGGPRDRLAFSKEELNFAATVGSNAALAIHNTRVLEARAASERQLALAQLVGGIVHDVARPLRVLERRALRISGRSSEPAHVEGEARKMKETAQQILSGLREMEASLQSDQPGGESAPLDEAVGQAVREFDDGGPSPRVLMSLAPGLPSVAHPARVRRVLSNLVSNALNASNASEPVWIYATAQEGEVRIDIVDRGKGMAPATVSKAFELFYTTRAEEGGSGVGLAIAREIVEDLGGKIELESSLGEGTRVTVVLPVV